MDGLKIHAGKPEITDSSKDKGQILSVKEREVQILKFRKRKKVVR